jgi:hypothetical protein
MRKIMAFCFCMMLFVSVFAQEKPRKDTVPIQKKSMQPPDTAYKNPIYKGPAEIDSINMSDSIPKGRRVNPIDRYREDSAPKSPKKGILY